MVNCLVILALHITHIVMSNEVQWSSEDNHLLFVNVYELANVGEAKVRLRYARPAFQNTCMSGRRVWRFVGQIYALATMWGLSCIKTLEFLRINRGNVCAAHVPTWVCDTRVVGQT